LATWLWSIGLFLGTGVDYINMFTRSFYVRKSQKSKKTDSQVITVFFALGTCTHKSCFVKNVGEIDTKGTFVISL